MFYSNGRLADLTYIKIRKHPTFYTCVQQNILNPLLGWKNNKRQLNKQKLIIHSSKPECLFDPKNKKEKQSKSVSLPSSIWCLIHCSFFPRLSATHKQIAGSFAMGGKQFGVIQNNKHETEGHAKKLSDNNINKDSVEKCPTNIYRRLTISEMIFDTIRETTKLEERHCLPFAYMTCLCFLSLIH